MDQPTAEDALRSRRYCRSRPIQPLFPCLGGHLNSITGQNKLIARWIEAKSDRFQGEASPILRFELGRGAPVTECSATRMAGRARMVLAARREALQVAGCRRPRSSAS